MKILYNIQSVRNALKPIKYSSAEVGFIPTMGALHEGHLSLVKKSMEECDKTIVSIFINPLQFNNAADLERYPVQIEKDLDLLESIKVDFVFLPKADEFYPEEPAIEFKFGKWDQHLEGVYRPGHFSGVALVVSKLFNIIQPDRAYFGLKDLQQLQIISQMVRELNFPVTIIPVETERERGGLAMSSRNQRLSQLEKEQASLLHKSLIRVKEAFLSGKKWQHVRKEVQELFNNHDNCKLEYLEVVKLDGMTPIESFPENDGAVCIAAKVGEVRLIDNMLLDRNVN